MYIELEVDVVDEGEAVIKRTGFVYTLTARSSYENPPIAMSF